MRIGVVAESTPTETRVAATPTTVTQLLSLGYDVHVESGAGERADFTDAAYTAAGATIVEDAWTADIVLKVVKPTEDEVTRLKPDAVLVAMLAPAFEHALVDSLVEHSVTAMAMDAVPRISRAQSLDVLSSMANIAGYRAVIESANAFGRFFTGQVTAAGKVPPAKVLVAGAGVAGLAAIGTAGALGAVVRATDPRPEVEEQVKSLGAEYVPVIVPDESAAFSTDGYAKTTSAAYDRAAAQLYSVQAAQVDIIITTALIPGRKAPVLITAGDVASMKPGSVIVDMAAALGGNVEGSVAGEKVVTANGVTIIGYTDLAARLPAQASQLYSTNLVNLMKLITPEKDGQVQLDLEDPVQRGMVVARDGKKLWPPPPVQVSAAPAVAAESVHNSPAPAGTEGRPWARWGAMGVGLGLLLAIIALAPEPIPQHFTVLTLAVVIGYYVIGHVHHALHTPLMSVTNAISGIIVVGALLQISLGDNLVRGLAFVAIVLASINVFGGFLVTRRMLSMFRIGEATQ